MSERSYSQENNPKQAVSSSADESKLGENFEPSRKTLKLKRSNSDQGPREETTDANVVRRAGKKVFYENKAIKKPKEKAVEFYDDPEERQPHFDVNGNVSRPVKHNRGGASSPRMNHQNRYQNPNAPHSQYGYSNNQARQKRDRQPMKPRSPAPMHYPSDTNYLSSHQNYGNDINYPSSSNPYSGNNNNYYGQKPQRPNQHRPGNRRTAEYQANPRTRNQAQPGNYSNYYGQENSHGQHGHGQNYGRLQNSEGRARNSRHFQQMGQNQSERTAYSNSQERGQVRQKNRLRSDPLARQKKTSFQKPAQFKEHDQDAERIQKYLANQGLGARREIEEWIEQGRIHLNGALAQLGDKIKPGDEIIIDGKEFKPKPQQERVRVLVYHKPAGEICSQSDPENRPTVFENLPRLRDGRWIMIGRLDVTTEGLLLFTNHGELAHRLMHPSYEIEREYAVRVFGEVKSEMIDNLRHGVELEDGFAKFDEIHDRGGDGANRWFHVTLSEGRNREVRRLWESQGVQVSRLIRVRYGSIQLPRLLRRGAMRDLDARLMQGLFQQVGLELPAAQLETLNSNKSGAYRSIKSRQRLFGHGGGNKKERKNNPE